MPSLSTKVVPIARTAADSKSAGAILTRSKDSVARAFTNSSAIALIPVQRLKTAAGGFIDTRVDLVSSAIALQRWLEERAGYSRQ